jgi:hypothetical protein
VRASSHPAALALALSLALAFVVVVASGPVIALVALGLVFAIAFVVPETGTRSRVFWWMSPGWAVAIAVLPGLILCVALPETYFLEHWRTPKLLSMADGLLIVALAATFVLAAHFGPRLLGSGSGLGSFFDLASPRTVNRLERATRALFWMTVAGYLAWALVGAARGLRPADVAAIYTGAGFGEVKDRLTPVGGVTTLTQFGPLAVTCLVLLRHLGSRLRTGRYLVAIFALAFVRNVAYAERLALIELAIPAFVLWLVLPRTRPRRRAALTLLPLWAPVALLVFFGAFEYFRSYSSEYYRDRYADRGFADFTVSRVSAYYATGVNNGVLVLESDRRAVPVPYYTVAGVWNFPPVDALLPYENVAGTSVVDDYRATLDARANPEFTNTGGMLLPVFDLGVPGAFAFWLLVGAAVGWAFHLFKAADVRGLLLYPVLFIGLLEVGLILYWPTGRAIPSVVGAIVLGGILHRTQRQASESSVISAASTRNVLATRRAP